MAIILVRAITWFAQILTMLLVLRAILSWFYNANGFVKDLYRITLQLTEPMVAPVRNFINKQVGQPSMIDFSLLIVFFLIEIIEKILIRIIMLIF